MFTNIIKGLEKSDRAIVGKKDTARHHGSGLLDVYATPAMISFMEKTSMECVQEYLPEGFGTVGFSLNIKHLKASVPGSEIICNSRLTSVDGMQLKFDVNVYCGENLVGTGTHKRYIIEEDKFLKKIMM